MADSEASKSVITDRQQRIAKRQAELLQRLEQLGSDFPPASSSDAIPSIENYPRFPELADVEDVEDVEDSIDSSSRSKRRRVVDPDDSRSPSPLFVPSLDGNIAEWEKVLAQLQNEAITKLDGTRGTKEDLKRAIETDIQSLWTAIQSLGSDATEPVLNKPGYICKLRGLKRVYPLRHFQVLGVSFMRTVERKNDEQHSLRNKKGITEPAGGVFADQMGLGKTVQMLANIMADRAENHEMGIAVGGPTLIVAKRDILNQWLSEIKKFCIEQPSKPYGYRKATLLLPHNRDEADQSLDELKNSDFVLTTYEEVRRSYPDERARPSDLTDGETEDWWKKYYEQKKDRLHQIRFHRIVLDEADVIKNHESVTSKACRALRARHYWAISATPALNKLDEIYAYFKFVRVPHTGTFEDFQNKFLRLENSEGIDRLNVVLKEVLLRRVHKQRFLGERLVNLPKATEMIFWVRFNEVEQRIYELFKDRMLQKMHNSPGLGLDDELPDRQKPHFFPWLMRLRRLCDSPLLDLEDPSDFLEPQDLAKLAVLQSNSRDGEETLRTLSKIIEKKQEKLRRRDDDENTEGKHTGSSDSENESDMSMGLDDDCDNENNVTGNEEIGGAHGVCQEIEKYLLDLINNGQVDVKQGIQCAYCNNLPKEARCSQNPECLHIYCAPCLGTLQRMASRYGHEHPSCHTCGAEISSSVAIDKLDCFRAAQIKAQDTLKGKSKVKKGGKAKKPPAPFLSVPGSTYASVKTMVVKMQIREWLRKSKTKNPPKILIFTQWRAMLHVLSKVLETERYSFVQYHGGMTHKQRRKALEEIQNDNSKSIMLMSLKCGGQGLNLNFASRMIILDPYWNHAIEEQAAGRINRIGQKCRTEVVRIVVRDTIDSAIVEMQQYKSDELKQAIKSTRMAKGDADKQYFARDRIGAQLMQRLKAQTFAPVPKKTNKKRKQGRKSKKVVEEIPEIEEVEEIEADEEVD